MENYTLLSSMAIILVLLVVWVLFISPGIASKRVRELKRLNKMDSSQIKKHYGPKSGEAKK